MDWCGWADVTKQKREQDGKQPHATPRHRCVRARMKYSTAACQPQRLRGRVEDEGEPEDESEAQSSFSQPTVHSS